jgi:hypothetical protein
MLCVEVSAPEQTVNQATLEREAALKAFRQMAVARVVPPFEAQMTLARGMSGFMTLLRQSWH